MTKRQKKWERAIFRKRFRLEVFGRDYDDVAIEKAVGRESVGSGTDLQTWLRDLEFEFSTERAALAAAQRIKKTVRGTRCMLHSSKRV
jgi:hypothetical protein